MSGRINETEMNNLFSKYISELDDGNDNLDILKSLEEAAKQSDMNLAVYEKALIAQTLYYRRLAEIRAPLMEKRFEAYLKKIESSRRNENIWSYFNRLIDDKGLNWKTILKELGLNPSSANQIKSGSWNLGGFHTDDLANISYMIGADPNEVLRLGYECLKAEKSSINLGTVAHFRKLDNVGKTNMKSAENQGDDEILLYINALDKSLDRYFVG